MIATRRRWGFRTRLTALIALVFITGGAVLLGVQYLLVQQLFQTAISTVTGCVGSGGGDLLDAESAEGDCAPMPDEAGMLGGAPFSVEHDGYAVFVEQNTMLSEEVLSGLVLWSIVTLLAFTTVAIVAAFWLSGRSFARIGQITDITQRITRDDLHQRLDLPGPADEIKELGDTIDTMLDRLEAAFTQQERFITNASHELRTPLTTTRTTLEIPLEQGRVPEDLQPALRRALDANHRSEQIIAALLELARTTHAAHHRRDPVPALAHDLVPIIEDSISRHRMDIEARGLAVTASTDSSTVAGVDATLLTLAIDNLVDNAIRHNTDDGRLHVSSGETAGHPWFEIVNTGARITAAEAELLTEPFNRGTHTRSAPGRRSLGLGLTLVHTIATSAGATLTLAPASSGGLAARVDFSGDLQDRRRPCRGDSKHDSRSVRLSWSPMRGRDRS